jgi:hypothetical protein
MTGCSPASIPASAVALLTAGTGRGSTVLALGHDAELWSALVGATGATGLVVSAGSVAPAAADARARFLRCRPEQSIPIRSHVIDAAVIDARGAVILDDALADEVRRVLAPRGDARLLCLCDDAARSAAALAAASLRVRDRVDAGGGLVVLIGRGP